HHRALSSFPTRRSSDLPYTDRKEVHAALMEAGKDWGIRQVGAKAYSSSPLESGWIPTPVPAIFSEDCAEYRQWLPAARVGALARSEEHTSELQSRFDLV